MNSLRLLHELTQSTNMVHDVEASDSVRHIILPNNRLYQLTRRDREVVDFTRSCVKNNTELTNLGN